MDTIKKPTWFKIVLGFYFLASVGLYSAWNGIYLGEKFSKGFYNISFGDQYTSAVLATALGIYACRMSSLVYYYYKYENTEEKCYSKFKCNFFHILGLTIVLFYNPKSVQMLANLLKGKPDNLMAALFFSAVITNGLLGFIGLSIWRRKCSCQNCELQKPGENVTQKLGPSNNRLPKFQNVLPTPPKDVHPRKATNNPKVRLRYDYTQIHEYPTHQVLSTPLTMPASLPER